MRLAFLSHCLPYPPDKGDRVRAYQTLRVLSSQGHRIHLLAIVKPAEDIEQRRALEEICEAVEVFPLNKLKATVRSAFGAFGSDPLTHSYFLSRRLSRRIDELRDPGRFDAVLAYSSAMAPYAVWLSSRPRLLDMVDVDSAKWRQYSARTRAPRRWIYGLEAKRLERFESRLGESFEQVIVATDREQRLLRSIAPNAEVATIRNGVSAEFFSPDLVAKDSDPTLVFTGQMDYLPNVDAARHLVEGIVPIVRREFPNLRTLIVGRSPAPEVQKLAGQAGVEVTGAVEDVRPYLARSWVFVAPLRMAQGIQNKVLEAMAMNLPVVCTPAVMAGLEDGGFREGSDVLVEESAADFSASISLLLANRERRDSQSGSALVKVRQSYGWRQNMLMLESLIASSVGRWSSSRSDEVSMQS